MNKIIQFKRNQIKIRKTTTLLFILLSIMVATSAYCGVTLPLQMSIEQLLVSKKVTLSFKNRPIQEILTEIKKQSGIGFAISEEIKKELSAVSIQVKEVSVQEVINQILKGTKYGYKIINNQIVFSEKKESLASQSTSTQNRKITITGKIVSKNSHEPISGATVLVENTSDGAISDAGGQFSLKATVGSMLDISFVGYVSQLIKVTGEDEMVISLQNDEMVIDEVVVTGIFTKSKESYTGSITSVSAKDIRNFKGQNLVQTLKNIDPSLNIVINNDFGSDPNHLPEINIRGNSSLPLSVQELNEGAKAQLNTPLVIMDGFEVSLQKLLDFNDEEIEFINILKDATATAIYGSRGANGVIVVGTKAPQAGKIKIYFKGSLQMEIPDISSYNVLNAAEKLELEKSVGLYHYDNAELDIPLKERYANFLKNVHSGVNTDWLSQPIQTGIGQKYNLRLEGGSDEFRWGASVSYGDIRGAMKGSNKKTLTGGITLSYELKNVLFRNQASITTNKATNSPYGGFDNYVKQNPYQRIHDNDGNLIKMFELPNGHKVGNPLYDASLNTLDNNDYLEFINNFSIEWTLWNNLKVLGKIGISNRIDNSNLFKPASHSDFDEYGEQDYFRKGIYQYSDGRSFNYDANITISYSKTFNKYHQIYAGLDLSALERESRSYDFKLEGYNNDFYNFLPNANFYSSGKPSGAESLSRSVGLTGNLNYSYDNRYFVDLSYRMDGASQFGTTNKFAPFWSAGMGWNLHKEKFLSSSTIINNLRLRGSIGETGSQSFSSYQALSTYQYYVGDRYLMWNGAYPMGIGNENLKWQKTKQWNIGAELGLFQNRILASFDLYQKKTSNLLSQMDIPQFHGFNAYTENVGSILNRGYEAMVSGYIIRNTQRELIWSITGKVTYNNNKIDKLSDAIKRQNEEYKLSSNPNSRLLYEGDPQNALYAVHSKGIDPSNGQELFVDRFGNFTYQWDARDRIFFGESEPKYRGNISTLFSYKNLSVTLSFGYHWGGVKYNNTLIDRIENADLKYNVDRRVYYDTWKQAGDVVVFKDIKHNLLNKTDLKTKHSSRFIQNDNMFQLQSAAIYYRLQNKWLKEQLKVSSIDFGVSTSDLFSISTIKMERGILYPFAQRVEFSLSLLF